MENLWTWLKSINKAAPEAEIITGGFCHIGKLRHENQDSFILDEVQINGCQHKDYLHLDQKKRKRSVCVVFDGMGGEADGGFASALVAEYFLKAAKEFIEDGIQWQDFPDVLNERLQAANRHLVEHAKKSGARAGTTICGFFQEKDQMVVFHIGDSRCYLFRNQQLICLTEDHTRAQQLYKMGVISQDEIEGHESRNTLTRHVGIDEKKYGLLTLDMTIPIKLHIGDQVLLATDGAYHSFDRPEVISILKEADIKESVIYLRELILEGEASDNLTCILTKF